MENELKPAIFVHKKMSYIKNSSKYEFEDIA